MTQKIDTIIFDLDGTLLDTLTDLTNSVNYAMDCYGFPAHTEQSVRQMVGNGVAVLIERAIPQGRDFPQYENCLKDFQEHYALHKKDCTRPFPGVMEFLKNAADRGYKLAVVSNKFDLAVKGLCEDFFTPYITAAIGESPEVAKKPAPDTVFAAMKELCSQPQSCVYVGDSDVDLATAKNAGIPCISVSWGFRDREFLIQNGAERIADTMDDIWEILTEMQQQPSR